VLLALSGWFAVWSQDHVWSVQRGSAPRPCTGRRRWLTRHVQISWR